MLDPSEMVVSVATSEIVGVSVVVVVDVLVVVPVSIGGVDDAVVVVGELTSFSTAGALSRRNGTATFFVRRGHCDFFTTEMTRVFR
ncbi:MAG: hypothetical protein RIR69_1773 [Actinomycetota bacterium]